MGMVVAGAATQAKVRTMGASEGTGVVGTQVALALARWTSGVTTDRIAGRGHISLSLEVLEQLFFYIQGYPHYFVTFQLLITHGFLCRTMSWQPCLWLPLQTIISLTNNLLWEYGHIWRERRD